MKLGFAIFDWEAYIVPHSFLVDIIGTFYNDIIIVLL